MVSLIARVKVMLRKVVGEAEVIIRVELHEQGSVHSTTTIHVTLMMTSAQVVEHQSLLLTKRQSFLDYTIKCQGSLSQDGDRYTVYNGCA